MRSQRTARAFAVLLLVTAALAISACSSAPVKQGAGLSVDKVDFENRSASPINQIRLLVPASGNFVSCGFIAPGARCASGFPAVVYRGEPIEISWTQGGEDWSTGEITLEPDELVLQAGTANIMIVVLSPGSAGAVLVSSSR